MAIAEFCIDPDQTLLRQLHLAKKISTPPASPGGSVANRADLCVTEETTGTSGCTSLLSSNSPACSEDQDVAAASGVDQALEHLDESAALPAPCGDCDPSTILREEQASRSFCTDREISSGACEQAERVLTLLDTELADCGTAEGALEEKEPGLEEEWDQFKANEQLFGVVSTFKSDLSQYTIPLDISKVPEQVRRRAERVASDIESSRGGFSVASEDAATCSEDDIDEEARWSAVPRTLPQSNSRGAKSWALRKRSGSSLQEPAAASSENDAESSATKVHGTFRLIDGVGLVDERVAQRWAWEDTMWTPSNGAELAAPMYSTAPGSSSVCPAVFQEPSQGCRLLLGAEVLVEGLTKAPAFNGLVGVVQSFDSDAGRYNVLLRKKDGGQQLAKIRDENLRLLNPWLAPPCYQ